MDAGSKEAHGGKACSPRHTVLCTEDPPVAGACELDRNVRIPKFLSVETMGKRSSKVPEAGTSRHLCRRIYASPALGKGSPLSEGYAAPTLGEGLPLAQSPAAIQL